MPAGDVGPGSRSARGSRPQQGRIAAVEARTEDRIKVAIIGVGNCASALVQGVTYYRDAPEDQLVPGLMHVNLGGYHVRDIEFSAAFDVDATKVGQDLSEAIFTTPNNTVRFAEVPPLG